MFHRSSTWKPNTHIHSHTLAGTQYAVVECQETDATTYRQETVIVFWTEQMCIFRPVKSETRAGYAVLIFSVRTGLLNQWFADHMRAMQLHVVPNFHQLIVVAVKASFCPRPILTLVHGAQQTKVLPMSVRAQQKVSLALLASAHRLPHFYNQSKTTKQKPVTVILWKKCFSAGLSLRSLNNSSLPVWMIGASWSAFGI